ncbi:MAG: RnfABCDGE type electron transport complex subunit D [Huintestinicola sp.]
MKELTVSPSPHIHDNISTQRVMLNVIIALMPACIAGTVIFGISSLIHLAVCTVSCVVFEYLCRRIMKRPQTVSDLSAVVTGLLLGMNLPAAASPLLGIIGSFIAIVITKQLFGGIGQNFANPAITARIILMLSFTPQMTTWYSPFHYKLADTDAVTAPTPLVTMNASYKDLFFGTTGGCIGETCAAAIILGGIYLLCTKTITLHAPAAFLGTAALLTFLTGGDPLYCILSGGIMLGAFFMATDYSTTPLTGKGKIIFGIGCGLLTFAIRNYGNYPEGVSFSILFMNLLTPYIDRLTELHPLGGRFPEKEAAKK